MTHLRTVLFVLILICFTARLWATNGLFPIAVSAKKQGRAGVDFAIAASPSAINTNPAGLAFLPGDNFEITTGAFYLDIEFENSSGRNDAGFTLLPIGSFAYSFEPQHSSTATATGKRSATLDQEPQVPYFSESPWRFGIGVFPQSGLIYNIDIQTDLFPEGVEHSINLAFVSVAPSAAYQINDRMSIGVSLNLNAQRLELQSLISQGVEILAGELFEGITFGDFIRELDGINQIRGVVDTNAMYSLGVGGRIGFLWQVTDRLTVGAAYSPQTWMQDLRGNAEVNFNRQVDATSIGDLANFLFGEFIGNYDIEIEFNLPQRAGFGISYLVYDNLLVAVDFQWIDYSHTFRELELILSNGDDPDLDLILGSNTVVGILPVGWDDQYVISVAAIWQVTPYLVTSFGYNYSTNPIDGEFLNPLFPGFIEHHFTFGGEYYHSPGVSFDLALEIDLPTKLKSGEINRVNPDFANSTLEAFVLGLSLGVNIVF